MTKGFDYKKRRDWPARGARREWPPLNPQETDPSLIINQISTGLGTLGSTTYVCLRQLGLTVPNSTVTKVQSANLSVFGGVISNNYPESAWLDAGTETVRFPQDGPYAMIVLADWDSNTTGSRTTSITAGQFATGSTELANVNLEGVASNMGFETGGDLGTVQLFQDSGADRDVSITMFIAYFGVSGTGSGGGAPFLGSTTIPDPLVMWSLGFECVGTALQFNNAGVLGSNAWGTANAGRLFPFYVNENITARKLFWYNGGVSNGNVDVAIYDSALQRVVSTGSTAQGTVSILQEVDITDTPLTAGSRYYLGLASSSTTAQFFGATTNGTGFESLEMAALKLSTFPLPADASAATVWEGASASAPDFVPAFGFTQRTLVV